MGEEEILTSNRQFFVHWERLVVRACESEMECVECACSKASLTDTQIVHPLANEFVVEATFCHREKERGGDKGKRKEGQPVSLSVTVHVTLITIFVIVQGSYFVLVCQKSLAPFIQRSETKKKQKKIQEKN